MNFNAVVAIKFIGVEGKSRTTFSPSSHGLIGGIQFRLKKWGSGEFVTCFLIPPSIDVSFHAGEETVLPVKINIPTDLANSFQIGSEFEFFEFEPVATGKILSIFKDVK